jgi:hypothetical protein
MLETRLPLPLRAFTAADLALGADRTIRRLAPGMSHQGFAAL